MKLFKQTAARRYLVFATGAALLASVIVANMPETSMSQLPDIPISLSEIVNKSSLIVICSGVKPDASMTYRDGDQFFSVSRVLFGKSDTGATICITPIHNRREHYKRLPLSEEGPGPWILFLTASTRGSAPYFELVFNGAYESIDAITQVQHLIDSRP